MRGICYGNCTKGKNWNRSERSEVMLLFRIRKSSETKPRGGHGSTKAWHHLANNSNGQSEQPPLSQASWVISLIHTVILEGG